MRQVKIYLELFKAWLTAIMEFWKSWNYNILYTDKFSNKITEDLWNCYSVSWKSVDLIHWSIQQKSCLVLIRYHSLSSFHQGCHFLLHFESLTKWRKKWKNQSIQICRCHKSHKICYDQKKMPCFSLKPIIFIWNNSKLLL